MGIIDVKENDIAYMKTKGNNDGIFISIKRIYDGEIDRSYHGSPYYDSMVDYVEVGATDIKTVNADTGNCYGEVAYNITNAESHLKYMYRELSALEEQLRVLLEKIKTYEIDYEKAKWCDVKWEEKINDR